MLRTRKCALESGDVCANACTQFNPRQKNLLNSIAHYYIWRMVVFGDLEPKARKIAFCTNREMYIRKLKSGLAHVLLKPLMVDPHAPSLLNSSQREREGQGCIFFSTIGGVGNKAHFYTTLLATTSSHVSNGVRGNDQKIFLKYFGSPCA